MSNRSTDTVFLLIKSLEKSEKRNFKLYVKRNSADTPLKVIQLFDALDKMSDYDEVALLNKNKNISKQQLSNLKAHLYKLVLSSLRLIKQEDNISLQLHEKMDFARILYNKGLYLQSLKVLDKMKEQARTFHQFTYLQQILFFEKKIESLYITRSMQDRAQQLADESIKVDQKISLISQLSNLSLLVYSWYIQHGVARNEQDEDYLRLFFQEHLPTEAEPLGGFYELLYYYQSYGGMAFICQDFLKNYRYSQKLVDLFEGDEKMIEVETAHYIKGIHNLMTAHFYLWNDKKLEEEIGRLKKLTRHPAVRENDNHRIIAYQYLFTARLNLCFLRGEFKKGTDMVPFLEKLLRKFSIYLDTHRVWVFYYKIASMYFGNGDSGKAVEYLNRIINGKENLRTDLQCYSRLLHLIAHYEMGNFELLEYLIKSVYRFMGKMDNLSGVEEEIFRFLKQVFRLHPHELKPAFEKLLVRIKKFEGNRFETRAFHYLDVMSWLESKINHVPVQQIIQKKYLLKKNRNGIKPEML
jgi:hypothetical protein